MVTAADLITTALTKLRVYAPGEDIQDADLARGMLSLNSMTDSWSNESLTTFATANQSFPLVPGQQSYTIGIGGNFNAVRPIRILDGPGSCFLLDENGNNYPVEVVTWDKWNSYSNTSSLITSDFPNVLWYDSQYPLGIINVAPFPTLAYSLHITSYLQLADFTLLTSAMSLPPGYQKAYEDNLALELAPYYPQAQITDLLVQQARESKGNVKRSNNKDTVAVFDNEIVSRANVSYNPYTDSVGSSIGSR